MPHDDRSAIPESIAGMIVRHLAEISRGTCRIDDEAIRREQDPEVRAILMGLLLLYEDLRHQRAMRSEADAQRERLLREREEAITARDQFISIAAHELKTPITSLKLQLELLRRASKGVGEAVSEHAAVPTRYQESLRRQLRRLERLVSELLDISRILRGRVEVEPEQLDLTALVGEVVDRFRDPEPKGPPILLVAPRPVWGFWDPLKLDQVVTNLVANAVRYGESRPIEVQVQEHDGEAWLMVHDQGIGIAPQDQERIFERFTRAVSDRHHGGLGLGLWLVRQYLEAMGGRVWVKSEPGKGTTFTAVLPRSADGTWIPPVRH